MKTTANFFVWLIAALHFVIAFVEMFLWTPLKIHKRLEPTQPVAGGGKKGGANRCQRGPL